jgi:hypothetical protein
LDRANINNLAAIANNHPTPHCASDEKNAINIYFKNIVPSLISELFRCTAVLFSGIIDENIDWANILFNSCNSALNRARIRNIKGKN